MSERQGGNHANAWNAHETAGRFIGLCQPSYFIVELGLLAANVLVDRQQRINDSAKLMILSHQFDDLVPELQADRSSEQKPILLDHAADLIFDISANADQTRPSEENGTDLLALFTFDLDLPIPTDSDQFGESLCVILILFMRTERAACA
jgi:hypothetical protein